jgi:hypothetical protein
MGSIKLDLDASLTANNNYYILVDEGFAVDANTGEPSPAITDANAVTFTAQGEFEVIETVSPVGLVGVDAFQFNTVSKTKRLDITFEQDVFRGTGNITMYDANDDVIEVFDVTTDVYFRFSPPGQANTTGKKITIYATDWFNDTNPSYVIIDDGVVKSSCGLTIRETDSRTSPNITLNWNYQTLPTRNSFNDSYFDIVYCENVKKMTGNVYLYDSDDNLIETIDVTTGDILNPANNAPAAMGFLRLYPTYSLLEATDYYITTDRGIIDDDHGFSFGPIVKNDPRLGQTVNVVFQKPYVKGTFTIQFIRDVRAGEGKVFLKKVSDNSIVKTWDVNWGSTVPAVNRITFTDNRVSFIAEVAQGTDYYILVEDGAFTDIDKIPFAGYINQAAWNFEIYNGPVITSVNRVSDSQIELYFDTALTEDVTPTLFSVYKSSTDDLMSTVGPSNYSLSGNKITINPNIFAGADTFYILGGREFVKAPFNFKFPGISNKTTATFTTTKSINDFVISRFPAPGSQNYAGEEISMTFDRAVTAGTGFIRLYKSSDDSLVASFDVTSDVEFTGNTVTINYSTMLTSYTDYYILVDSGCIVSGNSNFEGISSKTNWSFTSGTNVMVLDGDGFFGTNATFPLLNPPQIGNVFVDSGDYTLVLRSTNLVIDEIESTGPGSPGVWDPVAKTYTLTGSRSDINLHLNALTITTGTNTSANKSLEYILTLIAAGIPQSTFQTLTVPETAAMTFEPGVVTYFGIDSTIPMLNLGQVGEPVSVFDADGYKLVLDSTTLPIELIEYTGLLAGGIWDNVNKTYTITGSKEDINLLLQDMNLILTTATTTASNKTLRYTLTALKSGFPKVVTQVMEIPETSTLEIPQVSYYISDSSYPLIDPVAFTPRLNVFDDYDFTVVISSSTFILDEISSTGPGITGIWNNASKTYTLTGSRSDIEIHLSQLTISQGPITGQHALTYNVTSPVGVVVTRTQTLNDGKSGLTGGATFTYTTSPSGPGVDRLQVTEIFTSTYTCTAVVSTTVDDISSTGGSGLFTGGNTFSFSGNLTQINNILAGLIIDLPFYNSNAFTITYQLTTNFGQVMDLIQTVNVVYAVDFLPNIAVNQTITSIDANNQHVLPLGTDLVGLRNPGAGLNYAIDLSTAGSSAAVTWANVAGLNFEHVDPPALKHTLAAPDLQNSRFGYRVEVDNDSAFISSFSFKPGESGNITVIPNSNDAKVYEYTISSGVQNRVISLPTTQRVYDLANNYTYFERYEHMIVSEDTIALTTHCSNQSSTTENYSGRLIVLDRSTGSLRFSAADPAGSFGTEGSFGISKPHFYEDSIIVFSSNICYRFNKNTGSLVSTVTLPSSATPWFVYAGKIYYSQTISSVPTLLSRDIETNVVTTVFTELGSKTISFLEIANGYFFYRSLAGGFSTAAEFSVRKPDGTLSFRKTITHALAPRGQNASGDQFALWVNGSPAQIIIYDVETGNQLSSLGNQVTVSVTDMFSAVVKSGYVYISMSDVASSGAWWTSTSDTLKIYKQIPGSFVASGISTESQWDQVKNPTVTTKREGAIYTVSVENANGSTAIEWTVNVDLP